MLGFALIIFFSIIVAIIAFLAYYSYIIHKNRLVYSHIPGPPASNFFMGHVKELAITYRDKRHLFWLKCYEDYGPVYKVFIFHKTLLFASAPDIAKDILSNQHKYIKSASEYSPLASFLGTRYMGNGLVTVIDAEAWKVQRHGMNPAFHKNYLKLLLRVFNRSGDQMVQKLGARCENKKKPVKLYHYFERVGLDVISDAGFSLQTNSIINKNCPFPKAVATSLQAIVSSFHDPFLKYKPWKRQFIKEGKEAVNFLRDTARDIVREKIKNRCLKNKEDLEPPKDIMDVMVDNLSNEIDEDLFLDNFITLFIAGQETTANSLTFLFWLYGKHPEVYARVKEEVDALGLNPGEEVTYEHFENLKYTKATFKEALRLYPPATATVRRNVNEVEFHGYRFPENSNIVVSFFVLHRMFHENGETFDPERFYNKPEMPNNVYMPFSFGQRSCIGRYFALYEALVVITKLVQNFDFVLNPPNQTDDYFEGLTIRMLSGCSMNVNKRIIN